MGPIRKHTSSSSVPLQAQLQTQAWQCFAAPERDVIRQIREPVRMAHLLGFLKLGAGVSCLRNLLIFAANLLLKGFLLLLQFLCLLGCCLCSALHAQDTLIQRAGVVHC